MIVTVVSDVLGVENNGVTIAAMNLIRSLKEKGHTVRVLCPDVDRMGQEGYYIVPTLNAGPLNGYVERVGVVIARADQRIVRQAIKGADIVHIMLPFPLGRCALRIAKEEGIPVCAGFHAMAENVSVHLKMQNVPFANHLVYEYFAGFYRDCDAIHYPTQYLRDLYEGMYGKTNGYVISNGVSDAIHPVQTQRPARYEGEYLILFTGRYSPEKSHRILIDAVAQSAYRDRIRLIFAGKGPEKEKLVSYAQKLPLQPVFSFFSRPEMLKLLNEADLYVHPAEIEAEGIACLEAISCGLVCPSFPTRRAVRRGIMRRERTICSIITILPILRAVLTAGFRIPPPVSSAGNSAFPWQKAASVFPPACLPWNGCFRKP